MALTPFAGFSEDLGTAGRDFMLVERNAAALTQALEALLTDETLRIQLGQRARRRVEDRFDLEKSLDRYSALYHELAGSLNSR